jgi:hypothetical protein
MKSHSMLVMYYAASTVKYDAHDVREIRDRSPQIHVLSDCRMNRPSYGICLHWH